MEVCINLDPIIISFQPFIWTDAASAKSLLHEKSILKKQEQLKKENETEDISLNQTETLELKTGKNR